MISPRRRNAMTLLEVMLAISIIIGMMVALYSFYDGLLSSRARMAETTKRVSFRRALMDRVTSELRSAKVYPFIRFGLEGASDQMEFVTATLPGRAAWAVRESTDDPIPPEVDLQFVGYRLRVYEPETGETYIAGLERTCQKILLAEEVEEGVEKEVVFLSSEIRYLKLQYWSDNQWHESWSGGDLPGAVEIVIGYEPMPEDAAEDDPYPYESYRRVVFIPGGFRPPSEGSTVRGLGGDRR